MREYQSFEAVLLDWESLPVPGRLYIEGSKSLNWRSSKVWAVSSREAREADVVQDEYGYVPDFLAGKGVKSFLETATFQDIIENKFENNEELTVKDSEALLNAVNYYLDKDDFEN